MEPPDTLNVVHPGGEPGISAAADDLIYYTYSAK
jgi:hypothetical protein